MLDLPTSNLTQSANGRALENDQVSADTRPKTLIDLFAGCGGLSLGMEQVGFVPVHVNELNDDAMSTYLENRTHRIGDQQFSIDESGLLHSKDIEELIRGDALQELLSFLSHVSEVNVVRERNGNTSIDVIAGGPPCQGYSRIGIRRNYAIDRKDVPANKLYRKMMEVIARVRPRIFLFENVTGIRTAKWTKEGDENVWADVLGTFEGIRGYKVRSSVVRAKDYGVPQNRPRVLLVGIRDDIVEELRGKSFVDPNTGKEVAVDCLITSNSSCRAFDAVTCGFLPGPAPQRTYPDIEELLGDLVDEEIESVMRTGSYPSGALQTNCYPKAALTPIQKRLRTTRSGSVLRKGARISDHQYSKHSRRVVERFQLMIQNNGWIDTDKRTLKFSQRWLPPRWGSSGPFITVTSLPDDYVHFSQPRILTVREWARLQFFPDWFTFTGKRTTGGLRRAGNPLEYLDERELPRYTQIGNAVPVELARIVGQHFTRMLDAALK